MVSRIHPTQAIDYQASGTLLRPLLLGRLVRFLLGILCLSLVGEVFSSSNPEVVTNVSWWIIVILGLLLVNYVVNLGFGLNLKSAPLLLSLFLLGIAMLYSVVQHGVWLSNPVYQLSKLWLLYVFAHLGISFVIAALIATPGCEMRAIPHLVGSVRKVDISEHACPALIDELDKWEHQKRKPSPPEDTQAISIDRRDLLQHPARYLLFYGIPFLALQLAGNFGGYAIATFVPALAFLFIALLSIANIMRCRRIHSILLGPLFLVAGIVMGLYGLRLFSFGPDTWAIIVNGALIVGVCFSIKLEFIFGRYLGDRKSGGAKG